MATLLDAVMRSAKSVEEFIGTAAIRSRSHHLGLVSALRVRCAACQESHLNGFRDSQSWKLGMNALLAQEPRAFPVVIRV